MSDQRRPGWDAPQQSRYYQDDWNYQRQQSWRQHEQYSPRFNDDIRRPPYLEQPRPDLDIDIAAAWGQVDPVDTIGPRSHLQNDSRSSYRQPANYSDTRYSVSPQRPRTTQQATTPRRPEPARIVEQDDTFVPDTDFTPPSREKYVKPPPIEPRPIRPISARPALPVKIPKKAIDSSELKLQQRLSSNADIPIPKPRIPYSSSVRKDEPKHRDPNEVKAEEFIKKHFTANGSVICEPLAPVFPKSMPEHVKKAVQGGDLAKAFIPNGWEGPPEPLTNEVCQYTLSEYGAPGVPFSDFLVRDKEDPYYYDSEPFFGTSVKTEEEKYAALCVKYEIEDARDITEELMRKEDETRAALIAELSGRTASKD